MEAKYRMRPQSFERVEIAGPADEFPLQSRQSAARAPNAFHLSLMTLLAGGIVLPQVAVAGFALGSPELRHIIAEQPAIALQLALALVFWIALFAWPLRALFARLTSHRDVEITPETVAVNDGMAFGSSAWSAPLASYKGVAHHIRSSLSGNRHELVLVHPDPRRSVLLMISDHISEADVARMTTLLRLPQVPASELYGPRALRSAGHRADVLAAVPA